MVIEYTNPTYSSIIVNWDNIVIAKADSGATNNYWQLEDTYFLSSLEYVNGSSVAIPNNNEINRRRQDYIVYILITGRLNQTYNSKFK